MPENSNQQDETWLEQSRRFKEKLGAGRSISPGAATSYEPERARGTVSELGQA